MSGLIHLASEVIAALPADTVPLAAGDGGILDWVSTKNTEAQGVFRGVAVTLGIVFVIWQAVRSQGAMARILISLIAAGIFVWGVWNITDLRDRVADEVGHGPTVRQVDPTPSSVPVASGVVGI